MSSVAKIQEKRASRQETRNRLIKVGTEIMSERGFFSTGIDVVLTKAEVPRGSFYYYFESKSAFALAVVDNYSRIWESKLDRILNDKNKKPLERIVSYISEGASGLEKYSFRRGCLIGNVGHEITYLEDVFRDRILSIFASWTDYIRDCLVEAKHSGDLPEEIDVDKISRFFWIAWEGAILQARLERSPAPINVFRDVLVHTILKQ